MGDVAIWRPAITCNDGVITRCFCVRMCVFMCLFVSE